MKRKIVFLLGILALMFCAAGIYGCTTAVGEHVHTLSHFESNYATCTSAGNVEYWYCTDCNKYFTDEACTTETSISQTIIDATGHNFSEWYIAISPTCTQDGEEQRYCIKCGECETAPAEATGHSFGEWYTSVSPTCTEEGIEQRVCLKCGYAEKHSVEASGHTFSEWQTILNPTCTQEGEMKHLCLACGYTETAPIKPVGHDYETDIIAATCAHEGYTIYTCKNCGDTYTDNTTDKIEHEFGEWQQIVNPSCTEDGEKQRFCLNCGYRESAPIDATGHNFGEWKTVTSATCVQNGTERRTCSVCGTNEDREIAALGHSFIDEVTTPTCTEQGYTTHTCTREDCGYNKTDSYTDPLGHDMTENVVAPTCTDEGYTSHYCQREGCDYSYSDSFVNALDHDWKDTVVTPTCTEQGYTMHECLRESCGATYTDGYTSPTGHSWSNWAESKEATCTEAGKEQRVCAACKQVETRDIEPTGHNFNSSNTCTVCGYQLEYTANLTYTLQNGTYTVTGKGTADLSETLIIPKYYSGKLVTTIGESAFENCSDIKNIYIPDSITSIGSIAFFGCNIKNVYISDIAAWCNIEFANYFASPLNSGANIYLNGQLVTELVIPSSVTAINSNAFCYCVSLTNVVIPDSVTKIGYDAFSSCSSLVSAVIPNSVTSMATAFRGCSSLKNITIPFIAGGYFGYLFGASGYNTNSDFVPETLKEVIITGGDTIYDYAFYGCSGITSITIPNSVTSIGRQVFSGCNIKNVYINDMAAWCNIDLNYGFDGSGFPLRGADLYYNGEIVTELIIPEDVVTIKDYVFYGCTSLTSVIIPSSVVSIGGHAFSNCTSLSDVYIEDGVTSIDGSAFTGCISLAKIVIPDSVTNIGGGAFYGCISLSDISIPNNLTNIGDYTFYGCVSLTSITIPNSVISIGFGAFYNCQSLTNIDIPNSVMSISDSAFYNCNILNVYITDIAAWCNIEFESNYFANPLQGTNLYINDKLVTELVIPDGITAIKNYTFVGCCSITSVAIPNSVTSIGAYAFYGCNKLTSISIPNSVVSIGDFAFSNTNIANVTIGSGVEFIGRYAFGGNYLKNISIANPENWYVVVQENVVATSGIAISSEDLSDPAKAAELLSGTYSDRYWKRAE